MDEQIINAALTESDIQQINDQLAAIQSAAVALIQANTRLRDLLAAAIARHEQIAAESAEELKNE